MPSPVIVVNDTATDAEVATMRAALRAAIREYDADTAADDGTAAPRRLHAALLPCFDDVREAMNGIDATVDRIIAEKSGGELPFHITARVFNRARAVEDVKVANGIVLGMYLQRELDKARPASSIIRKAVARG